jgi:phage tail sheath protein FI
MAQQFLHGVETVLIESGPRPVTEVKTAIIGLVGIAPMGPVNTPILVKNDVDAAQFGKELAGFDIPQALNFIFGHNAGTVIVVNVFDQAANTEPQVDDTVVIANGKGQLAFAPVGDVTVKKQDGTPSTYIAGTDYTLDEFGKFQVIAGRIPNGTTLKFDYARLNPDSITNAQIIGAIDGSGNRTGLKALDLASSMFGFKPKILVVPGRSGTKAIADEMLSAAERFRAIALIDGDLGLNVSQIISNRGDATKSFGSANKRAVLCYPYLKGFDPNRDTGAPDADVTSNFPFSMFYAGAIAACDKNFGYWFSPSALNAPFNGVLGVERAISANINDPATDANALNEVGIVTVFNNFGTGYLPWGNRNASFPTNTQTDNFISLLRTFDLVHESLELAALPFIDKPITQSLIDDIRQSGDEFIAVLVGRGALTQGSRVVFDRADNSNVQLAAGQLTFTIIKDGPSPAERITYKSIIDISLKNKAIR